MSLILLKSLSIFCVYIVDYVFATVLIKESYYYYYYYYVRALVSRGVARNFIWGV